MFKRKSLLYAVYRLFSEHQVESPANLTIIERALSAGEYADRPRAAIRAAANVLVKRGLLIRHNGYYQLSSRTASRNSHPLRRSHDLHLAKIVIQMGGRDQELELDEARNVYQTLKSVFAEI